MKYLNKKLGYPYEHSKNLDDYQKRVKNLKNEEFFSKLKNDYPNDKKKNEQRKSPNFLKFENGEETTKFHLKSNVILLACVLETFIKVSIGEFDINPFFYVSLPGYTWQCGLRNTDTELQTHQGKVMILLLENTIGRGISSVMGDGNVKSIKNKSFYILIVIFCTVIQ